MTPRLERPRLAQAAHSARAAHVLGLAVFGLVSLVQSAAAQDVREGSPILPAHRAMYERGLAYLIEAQSSNGSFSGDAGVTGICVMALLASGEDPNFGRYAETVREGVTSLIRSQNRSTGLIGSGMYQHGFAMLCLADCYGAVDDRLLAQSAGKEIKSIGEALELAVRCAVTSQKKNPHKAWRYSPSSTDADTSAAGAILMGLLGARNAGIAVPDESLQGALEYFSTMTSSSGDVGYSGIGSFGQSKARSAICTLVFAVGKRRDEPAYKAAAERIVTTRDGPNGGWGHPCYTRYYVSQALFQADYEAWREWSVENTRDLIARQADDGSIQLQNGSHGPAYQTGMLLLSAALDYTLLPIYER